MAEFIGKLGYDFVAIESEHNSMHLETVQKMLQGLAASPTFAMVRVPAITYEIALASNSGGAVSVAAKR